MSYTPTTWTTGDTITASAMNKIENGIAGAGSALIVNVNANNQNSVGTAGEYSYNDTLDTTFADIYDALANGVPVYIRRNIDVGGYSTDYACCASLFSVLGAYKYANDYRVYALSNSGWTYSDKYNIGQPCVVTFSASSPSSYPTAIVNTIANSVHDVWD